MFALFRLKGDYAGSPAPLADFIWTRQSCRPTPCELVTPFVWMCWSKAKATCLASFHRHLLIHATGRSFLQMTIQCSSCNLKARPRFSITLLSRFQPRLKPHLPSHSVITILSVGPTLT